MPLASASQIRHKHFRRPRGARQRRNRLRRTSCGHAEFVPDGIPFYRGTILDSELLSSVFAENRISGVVHVAGFKYAGVSVQRQLHAYEQNVTATTVLLAAMQDAGVDAIVFSSSAAVYGTPDVDIVTESTPKSPESPYGESKLIGEWLLRDQGVAAGLRSPHYGTSTSSAEGRTPRINGTDYPTPDGTCVRDYIQVADLAVSHVAGAKRHYAGEPIEAVYNLGSGDGVSVGEIISTVAEVTGIR